MMQGIQGHDDLKRHINDDLNRGSSIVTQLIGGLALGGGVGAVVTAGGGLLPWAVIGAIAQSTEHRVDFLPFLFRRRERSQPPQRGPTARRRTATGAFDP